MGLLGRVSEKYLYAGPPARHLSWGGANPPRRGPMRSELPGGLRFLRRVTDNPHAPGVADADLLDRFVAHPDEAAFELLMWRHAGMVLHVCRALLRDHHLAEDAFQATFLALARKAASVRRGGAVA